MRIRTLGRSGLRVSDLCLGAMTFGMPEWGCDERESLALIDRYLAAGGNFIDTADAYSGTISEEICGKAMAGRRTQIVLATKATMPVGSGPNDRGSSRKHLRESCDASLRRLRTDYIDLYQIHAEDLWTPLEETLAALDDLVCAGKVLYVGASNFRAYRLMKALALSPLRFGAAGHGSGSDRPVRRLIGAPTAPPLPCCAVPDRGPPPRAARGRAEPPRRRKPIACLPSACRRTTCGTRARPNSAAGRRGRRRSAYEAPRAAADRGTPLGGAESKTR